MDRSPAIPLSRPDITDADAHLVLRTLRSGRLSLGPMLEEFERLVAWRAGRSYGVGVSSGTCGLHLALLALGLGPGDEVITTPFSFVASANCILYVGATPVFVDICPRTLNMDPALAARAITPRTRAIVAVEVFGNPAYMPQYQALAARHGVVLVEDACEALGTTLDGRPCGSFGRLAVFAFYPNKQITTGEGGMIVTDDPALADLCRSLRNQGRVAMETGATGSWLVHEHLGYNYRLPEMNAALGVAQIRRLDEIIARRQQVARWYLERLRGVRGVVPPATVPGASFSWFVFVVRLADRFTAAQRDAVIAGLRARGIGAAEYFPCIHLQPAYRRRFGFGPGMCPVAEHVSQRTIALPFHTNLTAEEVETVCRALEEEVRKTGG